MNFINELFHQAPVGPDQLAEQVLLALLTAFVVGQLNAWCYKWTHRGVSYSRTFTQALVLISIVMALSMSMVATNPIMAIGLLGGMAVIRFRTVVRDTRDTTYVFLCLIAGMAAGFGFHEAAVIGSVFLNLIAFYLHSTGFGAWYAPDGLLRFQIEASGLHSAGFDALLAQFCRRYAVVSVDESPGGSEGQAMCQCAYKVRLRYPQQGPDLIAALKRDFRIDAIHLLVEQEHEEVA